MITSLQAEVCGGQIKNMEVVENFEPRPCKAVHILVGGDGDSGIA